MPLTGLYLGVIITFYATHMRDISDEETSRNFAFLTIFLCAVFCLSVIELQILYYQDVIARIEDLKRAVSIIDTGLGVYSGFLIKALFKSEQSVTSAPGKYRCYRYARLDFSIRGWTASMKKLRRKPKSVVGRPHRHDISRSDICYHSGRCNHLLAVLAWLYHESSRPALFTAEGLPVCGSSLETATISPDASPWPPRRSRRSRHAPASSTARR
jgi:hypothetical protein